MLNHRLRCPLKHNADSLADEANGEAVRDRTCPWKYVRDPPPPPEVAHHDGATSGRPSPGCCCATTSCDDVGRHTLLIRTDGDSGGSLVSLYYPEAFAHGSGRPERTVDDRLVRLLRESDVGFVNSPQLDHHLDLHDSGAGESPWMTFEERVGLRVRSVLGSLTRDTPRSINDVTLSQGSRLPDLLRSRRAASSHLAPAVGLLTSPPWDEGWSAR